MDSKILLVADDEDMNRTVIKKFLKSDYEVMEAVNGREVLEILHERHVDVMLLDIIMPEMDGLEVLKAIQESEELKEVGVLVATSTKEKTERTALGLGADDIVSKPYDPIVIKKRLANISARKELEHQKRMFRQGDVEAVIQKDTELLAEKLESQAMVFHELAEVIKKNKDNQEMIDELTGHIHAEADKLPLLITDNR